MSAATQANVKRLLELTGLTHEELGEIAGVSRSAVSQWVRGVAEPRMGAVQRIADHFGIWKADVIEVGGMDSVSVDGMGKLYHIDPRDDDYVWRREDRDPLEDVVIDNFYKLTPSEREMLAMFAQFLYEKGEEWAERVNRGSNGKPYLGDLGEA